MASADEEKESSSSGHDHQNDHDHHHKKRKFSLPSFNMNMKVVFLHQVGDSMSSLFVLITALLLYFFPDQQWIVYIDPVVRYDFLLVSSIRSHLLLCSHLVLLLSL